MVGCESTSQCTPSPIGLWQHCQPTGSEREAVGVKMRAILRAMFTGTPISPPLPPFCRLYDLIIFFLSNFRIPVSTQFAQRESRGRTRGADWACVPRRVAVPHSCWRADFNFLFGPGEDSTAQRQERRGTFPQRELRSREELCLVGLRRDAIKRTRRPHPPCDLQTKGPRFLQVFADQVSVRPACYPHQKGPRPPMPREGASQRERPALTDNTDRKPGPWGLLSFLILL